MRNRLAFLLVPILLFVEEYALAQLPVETEREAAGTTREQQTEASKRELTKPPTLLVDSVPEYPASATLSVDVAVVLVLTIDELGQVREVAVSGLAQPGFDESAVRAARALRFTPAEVNGAPAAVRVRYRYLFVAPSSSPDLVPEPPADRSVVAQTEEHESAPGTPPAEEEVVVRGHEESQLGEAVLRPAEGAQVAGSLGDSLNVVQSLPGVSVAPNGSGEISVWGATPGETRVYIDNVPVPALYHRGGYRSVIHDALVERVRMVPAAFGPEHGRALGGIVQIETRRVGGEGTHGQIGADLIGVQAAIHTEPTQSFGVMAAGRVGYLDLMLPSVAPEIEQVVPLSAYRDYGGKVRLGEDAQSYTEVSAFGAFDSVERSQPTVDSDSPSSETTSESFHRITVRHLRQSAEHEDQMGAWLGLDVSNLSSQFSDVGTRSDGRSYRYGARASRELFVSEQLSLTLGTELEGQHTVSSRAGTVGLPAREGDIVAVGQSPATQVGVDDWTNDVLGVAGYVDANFRSPKGMFVVSPSLRFEPIVQLGDALVPAGNSPKVGYSRLDLAVSPRLSVTTKPLDELSVQVAASLVHQPASPDERSSQFGGTAWGLSHAGHGLIGLVYQVQSATSLELTGFAKYGWDLVMRNSVEPPPIAEALVDSGSSRTWGGQLLLRGRPHKSVSGWLTYTLSKAERRQNSAAAWRPSDFDQRHLFTVVVNLQISESWNVGARARGASGLPRTHVTGSYYDARLDAYQPLFGGHNRDALPFSFQLDLHAEWSKRWNANALIFYLDLVNLTNQENAVERTYNYDYSESGYLTSLPIFAVVGGKLEF